MNYTKISELPVITTVSDPTTAVLPIVDAGTTSQISADNFAKSVRNVFYYTELYDSTFVSGLGASLAIGDTDVYTVPSGRRACVIGSFLDNQSGGSVTYFSELKHSGIYYRVSSNATAASGSIANPSTFTSLVLSAGDSIAINVATTAGANVIYEILEFSDSSALIGAYLFGTTTGDNTIYTVPAGKTAKATSFASIISARQVVPIGTGAVAPGNTFIKCVKSGGSPTLNLSNPVNNVGITNGINQTLTMGGSFTAGDSIVVNVATGDAAQIVNAAFIEIDD